MVNGGSARVGAGLRRVAGAARSLAGDALGAAGETILRAAAGWQCPARAPASAPRSIFVLRSNDIGDLLAVTPLFEALRRQFPDAWIGVGTGGWSAPCLQGNPHVSEVLPLDAPWGNKVVPRQGAVRALAFALRSPGVRALATRRVEVGIDVLGSRWGVLLLLRAGIPCRLGVRGYAGGHSACHATVPFDPWLHVGRGALRFAELLGATDLPEPRPQLFLNRDELRRGQELWDGRGRAGGRLRVVVGPAAGLARKAWPPDSFGAVVDALGRRGGDVLVVGARREEELVRRVASRSPHAVARADLDLRQTFAAVAAADLIICNSSMLLHAAAAFCVPTVVMLGEAFADARQHQAQWGYPGTSWSLGCEPGRRSIYEPDEAVAFLESAGLLCRHVA